MTVTRMTIRVYNVGFGDCFLLRFEHGAGRPFRMLLDCGVHGGGGSGHPMSEIVPRIIADCTDPDGPHIDVVVVSHRHLDHVSGFTRSTDWHQVTVDEVWLPFTENPEDALGGVDPQRAVTRREEAASGVAASRCPSGGGARGGSSRTR